MFWIRKWLLFSLWLGMLVSLSACANSSPTALPQLSSSDASVKNTTGVIVEGRVIPKTFVNLSFQVSGKVSEILVKEGQQVKRGDILIRLGNRAEVEADVARAELELLNA
jgi:multidrug efflux pump subunit AcrA (membrane-fusion protein)